MSEQSYPTKKKPAKCDILIYSRRVPELVTIFSKGIRNEKHPRKG